MAGNSEDFKVCTKCKLIKSLEKFNKNHRYKDGYKYWCRECETLTVSKWAKKNKERLRKYHVEYNIKTRARIRDRVKAYDLIYRRENKDRIRARQREYEKINKEKTKAKRLIHMKKHPEIYAAMTAKRRSRKLKRTPLWANLEKIKEFYLNCPKGYAVDHVVPLQGKLASGLHVHTNLQYLTQSQNSSKSNIFEPYSKVIFHFNNKLKLTSGMQESYAGK